MNGNAGRVRYVQVSAAEKEARKRGSCTPRAAREGYDCVGHGRDVLEECWMGTAGGWRRCRDDWDGRNLRCGLADLPRCDAT